MKAKPKINPKFLPILFLFGIGLVVYVVYYLVEKFSKSPEQLTQDSQQLPTIAASSGSTVIVNTNTPSIVNLSARNVANGNSEKYIIPVSILLGEHYDYKIKTDLSSQKDIIYTVLGVEKNNELTIQITNNTGSNIVSLPIEISILKLT